MKVSYCTPCMGRLEHLAVTLPRNLRAARTFGGDFELVVLDYNCPQATSEWVIDNHLGELESGEIRLLRTRESNFYSQAHAKNTSKRWSTGEIVVNIDADNEFTPGFHGFVVNELGLGHRYLRGSYETVGFRGRIGLLKEHFVEFRGYDEHFVGWGFEDGDLCCRLHYGAHLRQVEIPVCFARNLDHGTETKFDNYEPEYQDPERHSNKGLLLSNFHNEEFIPNRDNHDWGSTRDLEVWTPSGWRPVTS